MVSRRVAPWAAFACGLVFFAPLAEGEAHAASMQPPACAYDRTGPDLARAGPGPLVRYDTAAGIVSIVEYLVPGSNLKKYFPTYLSTPGREPVRMEVEGPIGNAEAEERFGVGPAQRPGVYWVLRAPLQPRTSFAVYFDEVWKGKETEGGRPCASTFRRVLITQAGIPQVENERDRSGLRAFVSLVQPVSVEALGSIDVMRPSRLRALDSAETVRTLVTYRASSFLAASPVDAATSLDTRRGFDVSVSTIGPAPATLQYRYVIGRNDAASLVLERFAWSDGDAVATVSASTFYEDTPSAGSWHIRLDAGYERFVTLRINAKPNGSLQIVDATR